MNKMFHLGMDESSIPKNVVCIWNNFSDFLFLTWLAYTYWYENEEQQMGTNDIRIKTIFWCYVIYNNISTQFLFQFFPIFKNDSQEVDFLSNFSLV